MQFLCSGITSGQTQILSSPDHNHACNYDNGTTVCSINNPTTNYVITSSNGIPSMYN